MKKPPSKQDMRERLEKQVAAFLSDGGTVQELKTGDSAYDRSSIPPTTPPVFEARKPVEPRLTMLLPHLTRDALRSGAAKKLCVSEPLNVSGRWFMTTLGNHFELYG